MNIRNYKNKIFSLILAILCFYSFEVVVVLLKDIIIDYSIKSFFLLIIVIILFEVCHVFIVKKIMQSRLPILKLVLGSITILLVISFSTVLFLNSLSNFIGK